MESEHGDERPTKKRIGIYSGSFNPVHVGHQKLAEYLIANQLVDEVWFVVSPCNPLKKRDDLIDEYIRLDMLILAIQQKEYFKASDIEFTMPVPSYSIDTLHEFTSLYPDYQFFLVIGSDNALVFDQWKEYTRILNEYPILVYPRHGYDFEPVSGKYPQMQLLQSPYFDISSTQIRHFIAQKKDVSPWLHPAVYQFIMENGLYQ
ncbi:MAG: nicotinate (nicotinamide) nucleotide adenylyltransferase [Bacteroidota bacterium]|nr:nicotinate (nicotinamide) nucleotide adenylyltransferase [Bacteroidota bacterium]